MPTITSYQARRFAIRVYLYRCSCEAVPLKRQAHHMLVHLTSTHGLSAQAGRDAVTVLQTQRASDGRSELTFTSHDEEKNTPQAVEDRH